jgi:carboxymethylenebutenolidase
LNHGQNCCSNSATQRFADFANDAGFSESHDEPLPFTFQSDKGKWEVIKSNNENEIRFWHIASEIKSNLYLLVFHEWWGLNDYIKRECETFSKELKNVNVIAVDLYDGKVSTQRDSAAKFMQSVKEERARYIIEEVTKWAGTNAKFASVGWCFGGGWSLQSALICKQKMKACVMYYGMPEKNVEKLKELKSPVLGIFAKKDGWITAEIVNEFERNVKKNGGNCVVQFYDAAHAFANPSNPNYHKEFSAEAHSKTLQFLSDHFNK